MLFIDLFEDFLEEDEKKIFYNNIEEYTGKFKMHDSINEQLVNNYIYQCELRINVNDPENVIRSKEYKIC